MGMFKDFIPEGEDVGGQGRGFVDFVPDPKPVFHQVEEETPVQPEQPEPTTEPKKKGVK